MLYQGTRDCSWIAGLNFALSGGFPVLKSAVFWDIMQHIMLIPYRRFDIACGYFFKCQEEKTALSGA